MGVVFITYFCPCVCRMTLQSETAQICSVSCRICGGGGWVKLTNRDAMGILNELDRRWSARVNMAVLEATNIAHAVVGGYTS